MKEIDLTSQTEDQALSTATPAAPNTPATPDEAAPHRPLTCKLRDQGKIALLPHAIREKLNHRIYDAQPVPDLLEWLNSLSQTRQVVDEHFQGRLLTPHNLYAWRRGHYQQWLKSRRHLEDTRELATMSMELANTTSATLAEAGATLFVSKLLARFKELDLASMPFSELLDLAKVLQLLRHGDRETKETRAAREKFQLEKDKVEIARKAAEPRKPPTKEQLEEIERMLHIM